MRSRKTNIVLICAGSAIIILAIACIIGIAVNTKGVSGPSTVQQTEAEDCDLEDLLNKEDDCGFKKKTTAPAKPQTKPSPAKPQPRVTRR